MAIKKRTDQLPAILSGDVDNNDLMYLVHENAQAETGYDSKKILVSDVGRKINNGVEYATELPSFPSGYQNPLDALELLKQEILDLYPVDSASGAIANFSTSLALPLVALKSYIKAQGGGGTPTTPIAITGFSEVNVTRAGKNFLSTEDWTDNYFISATGVKTYDTNSKYSYPIKVNVGDTYTFSGKNSSTSGGNKRLHGYDSEGNWVSQLAYISVALNQDYQVSATIPNGVEYLVISCLQNDTNIMLEKGSQATTYEPYNATTFTLPLGQTVYGGYVDWENGKLVVTWGSSKINEIGWQLASGAGSASGKIFRSTTTVAKGRERYNPNNILCSIFTTDTSDWYVSDIDNYIMMINSSGNIYIRDDDYDNDVEGFVTALGETVLYFEMPTPIEISLPTTMPQTIEGVQNWFADSGDIDVSFKLTSQEYTDKKIAELQAIVLSH